MLDLHSIYKTFNAGTVNEKTALNGLNLHLNEGDFVTVIGGNGAGKSTMLNAVAGTWLVDEGKITIDDIDVTKLPEHKRAKYLGRVFQDPMTGTAATMQIEENMALAARRGMTRSLKAGITAKEREFYREQLKILGLGLEDRLTSKVGLLSGGQRQRVAIARALVVDPEFIIADEPVSMLDVSLRAGVLNLLQKMNREKGIGVLLITHDLATARFLCNRIVVMYLGKFVEITDPTSLVDDAVHPYTQLLISSAPDLFADTSNRIKVEGEAASAVAPPKGCRFSPRCPYAKEICRELEPELVEYEPRHFVACHKAAKDF